MIQNVQKILSLLFSITILSNCAELNCSKNRQGSWKESKDSCYMEITVTELKSWLSSSSNKEPKSAFYEHCDILQGTPITIDPKTFPEKDISLIAAIFSEPLTFSKYEKVHLYGGHRYFEYRDINIDAKIVKPKVGIDNQIGCLVQKSPFKAGNGFDRQDTWECGENGTVWEGTFPDELKETDIHAGCGYTTGKGMFEKENSLQSFLHKEKKIFSGTLITSTFDIFCETPIFLSDVYIMNIGKSKHKLDIAPEQRFECLGDVTHIGGRLFIINVDVDTHLNFKKLEEIGENLQYGKRPIIQVVGNKIPAISFPNLKKIHCEFSTDVCVVYANNYIDTFAGIHYDLLPKLEKEIWDREAKMLPEEEDGFQIFVVDSGNDGFGYVIIGFVVIILLILVVCSFWFYPKENDYPPNFNMNKLVF